MQKEEETKGVPKLLGVYNEGKKMEDFSQPWTYNIPEKPNNAIRFVCLSDTHSRHSSIDIPNGDVLLHAGDFTSTGSENEVKAFTDFIAALPHKHKIVIAGNHDTTFDKAYYNKTGAKRFHSGKSFNPDEIKEYLKSKLTYLEDSSVVVEGLKIYGSPWQPEFCDWAFNVYSKEELKSKWSVIPNDCNILITHGPPYGSHGGVTSSRIDAGCSELLLAIRKVKPLVHIYGHIHEGYGITKEKDITCINASNLDLRYKPVHNPIVFDVAFQ